MSIEKHSYTVLTQDIVLFNNPSQCVSNRKQGIKHIYCGNKLCDKLTVSRIQRLNQEIANAERLLNHHILS